MWTALKLHAGMRKPFSIFHVQVASPAAMDEHSRAERWPSKAVTPGSGMTLLLPLLQGLQTSQQEPCRGTAAGPRLGRGSSTRHPMADARLFPVPRLQH